ncbi:MAG: hypothetical protein COV44_05900 [Deltaproteobacteria bacterium CG11_big_fil_rev_8_21_14_0_20_45_16]|nr:MAG: hypothetical protein COV44_05900 [Deltaproteobacteria bacterium CG11_big_fil_rev_8_21_14_0_20_45_16]
MKLTFLRIFSLLMFVAALNALKAQNSLEKLDGLNKTPYLDLEYIIANKMESVGIIAASWQPSTYLTSEDVVYLEMEMPVSVGDQFTVYRDVGDIKQLGTFFGSAGRRIQFLGDVRVTKVSDIVEARIYNAIDDINTGNKLMPYFSRRIEISPRIPTNDIRGKILGPAEPKEIAGSYLFVFLDKGSNDGLRMNDKLFVYKKGHGSKAIKSHLPDVNIAELMVVAVTETHATAYVLNSVEGFEAGANFKTALPEIKYLDPGLPTADQTDSSAKALPNQ